MRTAMEITFSALLKAQPQFLNNWQAKLWSRLYCLSALQCFCIDNNTVSTRFCPCHPKSISSGFCNASIEVFDVDLSSDICFSAQMSHDWSFSCLKLGMQCSGAFNHVLERHSKSCFLWGNWPRHWCRWYTDWSKSPAHWHLWGIILPVLRW